MDPRILIIGAGISGLAAARTLHERGYSPIILEARNRIGGRIWTDRAFAGIPLEFGAEFVHGDNTVTWRYIKEGHLNTTFGADYTSQGYEHPEDGILSYEEICKKPDFERVFNQLEDEAISAHNPATGDISLREWIKSQNLDPHAREFALRFIAHQYLAEPENIGVADLGHEERSPYRQDDDDYCLIDGYDTLVTFMASGLDIRTGTPVRTVRRISGGVELHTDTGIVSGSKVIITIPPSLLAENCICFDPPLPSEKRDALRAIRTGHGLKLHLLFNKKFWDPRFSVYFSLGNISMWWCPTSSINNPNVHVLTGLVGGLEAVSLSNLTEEGILSRCLQDLARLFGSAEPYRCFVRGKCISWTEDPWSRGGYTYVPPGAYGVRQTLANPVGTTLFFAGDATVTESNPSTVHGAIGTGLRAAREVCTADGVSWE